ncbi:glycosyltransferase family 2 protein [Microbacterium ureisolvens]|uniref:Glycosyltransferase family 2 protein n=1 Tax=Microbacterium ureisolvens TaxID=2781186 RepID=A0ABS7I3P0_9MICO|nr:glycosyltransferase family 2 protein [Microbacterium ureisolvens]
MRGARPSVTVVIPVRDDAVLLRRCLEALVRQTWVPDEVIVVDDGSRDGSAAVAAEHGATVVWGPARGIASAAASGYDMASGEVIARLDADSMPPDDWLERLLPALAGDRSVGAVTGDAWFLDPSGKVRRRAAAAYLGAYRAVLLPTLGHTPLFGSNMAMWRDVWSGVSDEVHRDDDLLHDDMDLSFHIGRTHRILRVRGAAVGISPRPLSVDGARLLRLRRGFHTVLVHWPQDFPPRRWMARARSLRGRSRSALRPA